MFDSQAVTGYLSGPCVSRFEPAAAEPRDFRGRPVEVVDHQVEVDPVRAPLGVG
jgi:hypothetical protein